MALRRLMLLAIPLHIFGKRAKIFYIFSIVLNTFGSAWFCAVYYAKAEKTLSLSELFISLIPAGIILFLTLILLFCAPKASLVMLAVNFALSIFDIVQWVRLGDTVYSFGFFASVITFMCICAMIALSAESEGGALRYGSFAGFGIFIIIAFVVLLILSEGEILDGAIPDFNLPGKRKTKIK
ncbi:MAG: hypothetical protein IJ489_03425 [Clostridia bacterium]|nr:hypothetical protein [Clostridia bacterium]